MTSHPVQFGFEAGQTIIVTGAASGIGRSLALLATDMGLKVSAWDINPEGLQQTVELVEAKGGTIVSVIADVSSDEAVDAGFATTREQFPTINYLANNAGPSSAVPLEFDRAVDISLGSARRMTTAWSAPGLPAGAAMVATASVAGNLVGTESDWYSAAKAGLVGYVRHLAAHRAGEFRSNAVGPGMTDTPRLAGFADSEMGHRVLARNPLGRMATPEDIAYAVLFLLSPVAAYVNGVFLPVDGGWTVTQ